MGDGQQQIKRLAWGWKQRGRLEAKALEALFIGLMAPAQFSADRMLEMHHHRAAALKRRFWPKRTAAAQHNAGTILPIAGVQRSTDPMITSIEPRIAMMSATFTPFKR